MSVNLSADEVERRLPSLQFVGDDDLTDETVRITANAPDWFWWQPAASTHHHPETRKERGLWAHTLLLSTAIEAMVDTDLQRNRLRTDEKDLLHVAAILHDQRKHGVDDDPEWHGAHAKTMADVIRSASDLPGQVADAVESHMGPRSWDGERPPSTTFEELLHRADMIASRPEFAVALPTDAPEELDHIDLPRAEMDYADDS